METSNEKLKFYFLDKLSPQEVEAIELQIISDLDFAAILDASETELIEDYLEKSLTTENLKLFETNYLITTARKERVEFIKSLKVFAQNNSQTYLITEIKPSFFDSLWAFFSPRKLVFGVGGLALILTVGISSYLVWKNYNNQSDVLIALNNSQKNERPLDSRISDLNYSPKVEGIRGNSTSKNEELEFAELSARNLVRQNPSAENLHELGRVFLAQSKFDDAIVQLEKGIKKNPNISKLHNDLGVALMEKGRINQLENDKPNKNSLDKKPDLELFVKANEFFAKAIELDKTSLESYFNLAICIESQKLQNQAKEAWENYLKLDSSSKWADEARERLKKLEANKTVSKTKDEILKEFFAAKDGNDKEKAWQIVSGNRELSSGKLIPQQLAFLFLNSKVNGDDLTGKKALDALVYVGKLEEEKSGDLFWRDLANYYQNRSSDKISLLTQAKSFYLSGLKNSDKDNEIALSEFSQSDEFYTKSDNELEKIIVKYWKAYTLVRLLKLKEGYDEFEKLANLCKKKSYKWLALTANGWLVGKAAVAKNISLSIELSKSSLAQANETSDIYHQQRVSSQLSEIYFQTGQTEKAIYYLQKSLEFGNNPYSSLRQKWRDLDFASNFFYGLANYETALIFEKEALSLANNNLNEKSFNFTSLVQLGLIYGTKGDFQKALDYFSESQKITETIPDAETKKLFSASTNLQLGSLYRINKNCSQAIEHYNQAISFYGEKKDLEVYLYNAWKGRFYCYFALSDEVSFQRELPQLLELFHKYRSQILEEQNRNSFFDNEQDVYDIAVDYEFSRSSFENAFNYAEESRSRSLLDLQNSIAKVSTTENQPEIKLSGNFSQPFKISQIQAEMSVNTQLLTFSVLPEKVLIWTITKDRMDAVKTDISAEKLKEKVIDYLNLISSKSESEDLNNLSKELYQILIVPIKDKLDKNKQIFIIPDKVLFRLPFGALHQDQYLVEEFNISYSPSANIFLNCSNKAKEHSHSNEENLLSIGNPTFNPTEFSPKLPDLPSAKIEAEKISQEYLNPVVLVNEAANKEQVKAGLTKADVVHIAGHYLIDEKNPWLSSLVLAGETKTTGNLANYEIISQKLTNIRLIVLSACDTGIEKYYQGEGMIGASRTFLAIGIPLVVASQWEVDSEATKDLMIRFHQIRRIQKIFTSEALRLAQIEMLKNEKYKHPYYWASFAALGGHTQF